MRDDDLTTSILAWLAVIAVIVGFALLVRRRNRSAELASKAGRSEARAKDATPTTMDGQLVEDYPLSFGVTDFVCTDCHAAFSTQQKPARTTLGFVKAHCPKCSKDILYPLSGGYRVFYWVCGIVLVLGCIKMLSGASEFSPGFIVPGILYSAMIVALIKDAKYRKLARIAWEQHKSAAGAKKTS